MGGEDERHAPLLEPVEAIPEQVSRLRVETGGGLIEEQEGWLVDQRPGDRQPPLHPAGQRLDLVVGALGQLGELEQLVRPPADLRPAQTEVAAVDREVLADRQFGVQGVLLGHDAQACPDLRAMDGRGPCP